MINPKLEEEIKFTNEIVTFGIKVIEEDTGRVVVNTVKGERIDSYSFTDLAKELTFAAVFIVDMIAGRIAVWTIVFRNMGSLTMSDRFVKNARPQKNGPVDKCNYLVYIN